MSKLIIFDLDGVLIDSRDYHYFALNKALNFIDPNYQINYQEHLGKYDGLNTKRKLELLTKEKNLPLECYDQVWQKKQEFTCDVLLEFIHYNPELQQIFSIVKEQGYHIAVASNSIRKTTEIVLSQLRLLPDVEYYISNEDVQYPKPYPEMYWKCMVAFKTLPCNTIIVEDSHIGREGALNSGAILYPVKDTNGIKEPAFLEFTKSFNKKRINIPWRDNMNILIPMAGKGSRFAQAGYTFPKPLIEINNKPMIQLVVENLNIQGQYIFIVLKEEYEKYNLKQLLNLIAPNCKIIIIDKVTEGAACTTLLAKEFINNNQPLLLANADQFIEWNSNECMYAFNADNIDGGILTFESVHPKWSYAKLDENNFVTEVAEKNPISNHATVGIYFWKKGSDYVKYAEQMINKNIRVNNEFYVCPVFNEAIQDKKKIRTKQINKMWGLGTPEDLTFFLNSHK